MQAKAFDGKYKNQREGLIAPGLQQGHIRPEV
jgi:hypothetical protein